jgi:hypothetical protein
MNFSFELSWLRQEGFIDMVKNEWLSIHNEPRPIETWQKKIRHMRQFLRGWARNLSGNYKKEKERLLNIINSLDIKAETVPLSESERTRKKEANERLLCLRREEETKWAQRAKVKYIQEGGDNTKYFHLIANGKHRKKKYSNLSKMKVRLLGKKTLEYSLVSTTRVFLGLHPRITSPSLRIGSRIFPNSPLMRRTYFQLTSLK